MARAADMPERLSFLLLGDPVAHSRSPFILRSALDQAGLTGVCEAVTADGSRLELEVERLRAGAVDGLNVTMPLKAHAASVSERLTPEATASGSVNTIRARDGVVEGHSTDVTAFTDILSRSGFHGVPNVLVLGGGGAASAALAALVGRNVYLAARDPDQAARLSSRFGLAGVVPWGSAVAGAVLINATPIGMHGNVLPDGLVAASGGLIDLAYGASPTPAVLEAQALDTPHLDGLEFLVVAAAASFQWWTDAVVDSSQLLLAARNA